MNQYLDQFQAWLQEEDKGDKTIRTYLSVMKQFIHWQRQTEGEDFDPRKTTPLLIQDYRSYMANTLGQKPATINKAIATLKTFFAWAVEADHVTANPAIKVKVKRVQKSNTTKWLTDHQKNRLLLSLETEKNEYKQARDKAIVMSMLKAGLRVEEVSELKIPHLDMRGDNVTVYSGKGGKFRSIPLNADLKKVLKVWLKFRKESTKEAHVESDYVFVSERSGQMTTRAINYMVDEYLERCGLLERSLEGKKLEGCPSCHSLRHTFEKDLVDAGVPIQEVSRLMGHDNLQTTMIYVEPSDHDLRKSVNKI